MTRFYATMALAIAISGTALAAGPQKMQQAKVSSVETTISKWQAPAPETTVKKLKRANGPKKVASVSDLAGYYNGSGYSYLGGDMDDNGGEPPYQEFSMQAVTVDNNPNQLKFKGFFGLPGDVTATVDLDKQTVTFPKKEEFWFSEYYNAWTSFQPRMWNEDGQGNVEADYIVADIDSDGNLVFDWQAIVTNYIIGTDPQTGNVVDGYFLFLGSAYDDTVMMTPIEVFTFDPSEWTYSGTAQFTDGWMAPLLGYNYEYEDGTFYEITYPRAFWTKNGSNNAEILIEKPYGYGTPFRDQSFFYDPDPQYNFSDVWNTDPNSGWIYIDATDTDCVIVPGATYSGYRTVDYSDFFMWNVEGYYMHDGYDIDSILGMFEYYGLEPSYMQGDNLVINNCVFGISARIFGSYDWVADYNQKYGTDYKQITRITLDFTDLGVNNIVTNNDEAVKYFNLQGQEVLNPAKGQLVIKTQGDKAQKLIVR